jgi:hypothetical protein
MFSSRNILILKCLDLFFWKKGKTEIQRENAKNPKKNHRKTVKFRRTCQKKTRNETDEKPTASRPNGPAQSAHA